MIATAETHEAAVCEDHDETRQRICDTVASLGHKPVPLTTLEEMRAYYSSGRRPCYVLQDMQMPHRHGAPAHEAVGDSGIGMLRAVSTGPWRIPCIVLTSFSKEAKYVMHCIRLGADDFLEKSRMSELPETIRHNLKATGREDHAECARCAERSRPAGAAPEAAKEKPAVARLLSHEGTRGIDEEELARIIARRKELDLFLNARDEEAAGYLAGRRDLKRNYRETYISRTDAEIIAELVEAKKEVRANALKCLRAAGCGAELAVAVRMVQKARKLVDVHALVNGRESQKRWRSIHTTGDKNATAFCFRPPATLRWSLLLG
jgi:CheY-like chemotaxis protein